MGCRNRCHGAGQRCRHRRSLRAGEVPPTDQERAHQLIIVGAHGAHVHCRHELFAARWYQEPDRPQGPAPALPQDQGPGRHVTQALVAPGEEHDQEPQRAGGPPHFDQAQTSPYGGVTETDRPAVRPDHAQAERRLAQGPALPQAFHEHRVDENSGEQTGAGEDGQRRGAKTARSHGGDGENDEEPEGKGHAR